MQKSTLFSLIREELVRATLFALFFLSLMFSGFTAMSYAANDGGIFGTILNKILSKPWDDPTNDGTVKNALQLGGNPANTYTPIGTNRSCGGNQCIYGFTAAGDVKCR